MFVVQLDDGSYETARRVLIATGMDYRYPDVPGSPSAGVAPFSIARSVTVGRCATSHSVSWTKARTACCDHCCCACGVMTSRSSRTDPPVSIPSTWSGSARQASGWTSARSAALSAPPTP